MLGIPVTMINRAFLHLCGEGGRGALPGACHLGGMGTSYLCGPGLARGAQSFPLSYGKALLP